MRKLVPLVLLFALAGCNGAHRAMKKDIDRSDGGLRITRYYLDAAGQRVLHGKCVRVTPDGRDRSVMEYRDGVLIGAERENFRDYK